MSKHTSDSTVYNTSGNKPMSAVLEKALSRRGFLKGTGAVAAMSAFASIGLSGCGSDATDRTPAELKLGFDSLDGSRTGGVVVPKGYSAQILAPWGTPLNKGVRPWDAWKDGTNNITADEQANAMGMHHDGMYFFPLEGSSTEGILCINHEYIDQFALHFPDGPTGRGVDQNDDDIPEQLLTPATAEEVRKEINAHGVSVVHVKFDEGVWRVQHGSEFNRRFTAATEMDVSGPIASSGLLVTKYTSQKDNENLARGTNNNCGNGHTPWGTYLTCEENWPGYFVRTDDEKNWTKEQRRMGISPTFTRYLWETPEEGGVDGEFERFDITPQQGKSASQDFRNEANGHGYIVEIDPYDPQSRAVKRTALGRFRHEDCSFGKLTEGKPVVFYSGHDGKFEYIYKFVSDELWNPADATPESRLASGAKYMDNGTLYVARFDEEGRGNWLPLTTESETIRGGKLGKIPGFASLAEIILNAPGAADLLGATPMDRPEWTAVDPQTGSVYVTLTNNSDRDAANPANPRENNQFGHIIRWDEGEDPTEFSWEFFLFGSSADAGEENFSSLTASNELASPDGLTFDERGILWIQTDNSDNAVAEKTNDQMLAVVPARLQSVDGKPVVQSSNQGELKRFFVGPDGCEVTGVAFTPDHKTMFVNIQHPGNWPAYDKDDATVATTDTVRPRASTVVITRDDGGEIGV